MDYRIISIGALACHPLWGERAPVRTGHATTTLIRSKDRVIVVDPSLPELALEARLLERANLRPGEVTDVFLTSFRPDVRRGVALFESASWWIGEAEREAVGAVLATRLKEEAQAQGDEELIEALSRDVAILRRTRAAGDRLADQVDLFPMPGVTPGLCGLLLEHPRYTVVVCGDGIPTVEHLERGMALSPAVDVDRARSSMAEAVEVADLLVPGRDNVVVNPTKRPF
ncbi:MAG: MBL fold metallo-hydrolase [Phycisphaeraceae bacterium]|nr:MBL fold metallo-hydrolase [Phycisphaerae bacterium]MBX3393460.1 MBL fold metallo-hydrolase [Phycisphaeraceae bacterium]HRJ49969.1 MBL fold metallo-hydrolase [Phycisphaerales bacterium]